MALVVDTNSLIQYSEFRCSQTKGFVNKPHVFYRKLKTLTERGVVRSRHGTMFCYCSCPVTLLWLTGFAPVSLPPIDPGRKSPVRLSQASLHVPVAVDLELQHSQKEQFWTYPDGKTCVLIFIAFRGTDCVGSIFWRSRIVRLFWAASAEEICSLSVSPAKLPSSCPWGI